MSKLIDDLYDLVSLAKQESEPNRYDNSDGYKELFNRLENALSLIDNAKPSEALKCLIGLEKEIIQRDGYITNFLKIKFDVIKQALTTKSKKEMAFDELKILINDLESTFNRKGIASINDDNLGTFIKDYFLDNASDTLKEVF